MALIDGIARAAKDICKTGPFTAEGTTDIYGLTFASMSNLNDIKGAGNNLSVVSTTGQIISSIASLTPFGAIATSPAAGVLTLVKISTDAQSSGQIGVGDILNVVGNGIALAGGIVALGTSALTAGLIISGIGAGIGLAGLIAGQLDWKINISSDPDPCSCDEKADNRINDNYRSALSFTITARDPLAIDLDQDGIETVAINPSAPILFDHDGDGAKTATGWLKGDDGWLVNDLDLDGKITSGKELLGVDTDITVGGVTRKATTGFEALRALDTHQEGDGKNLFDSRDAAFSKLRIWQDKNQNGATDASELSTLSALGIVSIELQETPTNINLVGGNSITGTAKVIRRVGTSTNTTQVDIDSVLVSSDAAANLNLAENPFYTDLPDLDLPVNDTAWVLPDMQGSGLVYSLREAMSLGNAASNALTSTVQAFAAATTRDAQLALLDKLIAEWGATSTLLTSGSPSTVLWGTTQANTSLSATTQQRIATFAQNNPDLYRKVIVLEQFNGQMGLAALMNRWNVTLPTAVTNSLNAAYTALQESVYSSLVVQTRLKPYMDAVELFVDDHGLSFDLTKMSTLIANTNSTNISKAITDVLELNRFAGDIVSTIGFDGVDALRRLLAAAPSDLPLLSQLPALGLFQSGATTGTAKNDVYLGNHANNDFASGDGNDVLSGGAGADLLKGGAGNDLLQGDAGDDQLRGESGSDIYVFGIGDGRDTITFEENSTQEKDIISLKEGITLANINIRRGYQSANPSQSAEKPNTLIIEVTNTRDRIFVSKQFDLLDDSKSAIEEIRFHDGTFLNSEQIRQLVLAGTHEDDLLIGYARNDTIYGGNGADTIIAGNGEDDIDGGDGDDSIQSGKGRDIYRFGLGSGHDTLHSMDTDLLDSDADAIVLGAGIQESDLEYDIFWSENSRPGVTIKIKSTGETLSIAGRATLSGSYASGIASLYLEGAGKFIQKSTIESQAREKLGLISNLYGDIGDDEIIGTSRADQVTGYAGNDTLSGGFGNDTLIGGTGSDVYKFQPGDGKDFIDEANSLDGVDTLQLSGNIQLDDLYFYKENYAGVLRIGIKSTGDYIRINQYFSDANRIENIYLPGGQLIARSYITENTKGWVAPNTIRGTDSNDTMVGSGGDDRMLGEYGNDKIQGDMGADEIYGYNGNDTIDGGPGNDRISGDGWNYGGADVYIFNIGSGQDNITFGDFPYFKSHQDEIHFGEGITASDITLRRQYTSLYIEFQNSSDRIEVSDYFSHYQPNGYTDYGNKLYINNPDRVLFRFFDNSTLTQKAVWEFVNKPSELADVFEGLSQNDSISALAGDDLLEGNAGQDTLIGGEGDDKIYGGAGIDSLIGDSGDDRISGGENDDFIYGGHGKDYLYGDNGSDYLSGGAGRDFIETGNGRDTVDGGPGDDFISTSGSAFQESGAKTFLFDIGDGKDTIYNFDKVVAPETQDSLIFGAGIDYGNVTFQRVRRNHSNGYSDNLLISINNSRDSIEIPEFFKLDGKTTSVIHKFIFSANNKSLSLQDVLALSLQGAGLRDTIYGYASDDMLLGSAGDDSLSGEGGSDTLDGGDNRDFLSGGAGRDSLNGGSGNDTLYGDSESDTLHGGDGDDHLFGGVGDDTLNGGTGADRLEGGSGNDTYVFAAGDGADVIHDNDATSGITDVISFTNVKSTDITSVVRNAADALVLNRGASDSITIENYFTSSAYRIEKFMFSDGVTWTTATIDAIQGTGLIKLPAGGSTWTGQSTPDFVFGSANADSVSGLAGDDWLHGEAGNDTLRGGEGADYLVGGLGNDVLHGDAGADTYVYNKGDGYDVIHGQRTEDTLRMSGFNSTDVVFKRQFSDINIVDTSSGASHSILTLVRQAQDSPHEVTGISQIVFDDVTLTAAEVRELALIGTAGSDTNLRGYASDDTIYGFSGNDSLYGEGGDDTLYGGAGKDVLVGGTGGDYLGGGSGSDTYIFSRGDGQDGIYDSDATAGNTDVLQFQEGISHDQLWFSQIGKNLLISVIGTSDVVMIAGGSGSLSTRIEQITAGGKTLSHTQVSNLVQAMASMTPPAEGQMTLTDTQRAQLAPVLAANWS